MDIVIQKAQEIEKNSSDPDVKADVDGNVNEYNSISGQKYFIDGSKEKVNNNEKKTPDTLDNLCGLHIDFPAINSSPWNYSFTFPKFKTKSLKFKTKFCTDNASNKMEEKKSQLPPADQAVVDENKADTDKAILKDEIKGKQGIIEKEYTGNNVIQMAGDVISDTSKAGLALITPLAPQTSLVKQGLIDTMNDLKNCRLQNRFNIPLSPCQKALFKKLKSLFMNSAVKSALVASGVPSAAVEFGSSVASGKISPSVSDLEQMGIPEDIGRDMVSLKDFSTSDYKPSDVVSLYNNNSITKDGAYSLLAMQGMDIDSNKDVIDAMYKLSTGRSVMDKYGQIDYFNLTGTSMQDAAAKAKFLTDLGNDISSPDPVLNPTETLVMNSLDSLSDNVDIEVKSIEDV